MEHKNKSGFVTIIGRPNVGKSTLMNRLVGQKVAITSNKPQTTRNRIQAVHTDERGQIVFLDTPGIHKARNKLGEYMVSTAEHTLNEVDLILWIVEAADYMGEGERRIAERLNRVHTPVILIMNKIDEVEKGEILGFITAYKDVCKFAEIIPVSALTGENTESLLEVFFGYLEEGPRYFDEDEITDQPERQMVAELIREQALRKMKDEIPHGIAVLVESMKDREKGDLTDIDATIICEKNSHKGMVIGKNGQMLKAIGMDARKSIEALLGNKVNLQLWVKVKKDWRDSDFLLRNFGYQK